MRHALIAIGLLVAGPLGAQPGASQADVNAGIRREFSAAYAAAAAGTAAPTAADSVALQAYSLYPYLRAARIEHALGRADDAWSQIDDLARRFLNVHGDQPIGRALRRAWLASLARRSLWRPFLDAYDAAAATPSLGCEQLNARIAVGDVSGLAPAIIDRWLTPHRLPPECETAFQWLRDAGALTDQLVARRATLLLDNGQAPFARVIAQRLTPDAAAPLLVRAAAIQDPAGTIDAWLAGDAADDLDYELVLDGWSRLARDDPNAALARFAPLASRAPDTERASRLALALALGLAWDRRPEALEYFARVAPDQLDDYALEWLTRAALWSERWDVAAGSIAAMSLAKRAESSWRYWAARAAEKVDGRDTARELYASVLADDNYYAALAAARLGDRLAPRPDPLARDDAKIDAIASDAAFVRARELQLAGLRTLATNEWRYGYDLLPDELRPQAIHLAALWGMYDVAVATATSHGVFSDYELLYPRPYVDEVAAAAKLTQIDRSLLYGVLRQESLFRPDAASSADAIGVAQLQHDTARVAARRWQLPAPSRADLFDPAVSITLGAARLTNLIEQFDGQLPVALAGYNAGENAVKRWLPDRAIDSDIWVENIPYNETRAYVRRVLWHSLVFEWLDTGRPQSARQWLDEVAPR